MTDAQEQEDDEYAGRWISTIESTVASLAAHLGQQVTIVGFGEMKDAFFCRIRGPELPGAPFRLAWDGVLGMEHLEGRPDISATLFLYSHNRRLRLDDEPGSTFELAYAGPLDGSGTWREEGWFEDVFGEFESYDHYRYDTPPPGSS